MKKTLLFSIVLLLFSVTTQAQTTSTSFAQRLDNYFVAPASTRIQLVFNQPTYTPGDTVFFKAYFLSHQLKKIRDKQLLHLNLVDAQGVSRLNFMFHAVEGIAQNQIILPQSLPAGIYLVTVNSNWAKDLNDNVWRKTITVVRENKVVALPDPVVVGEGGHIIAGLKNHVVIRTQKPLTDVVVTRSSSNEGTRATTNGQGVAHLMLTPELNESYHVVVDNQPAIPVHVQSEGVRLFLKKNEQSYNLSLSVSKGLRNKELNVITSSQGQVKYSARVRVNDQVESSVEIPFSSLQEGMASISVLDDQGNVLSFRNFYNASRPEIVVDIVPVRKDIATREEIAFDIQLKDSNGQPIAGEFSVGIINAELFSHQKRNSFADELNVALGGKDHLLDRGSADWESDLDLYLISDGTPLPWKHILANSKRTDIPFVNWIQKSGTVYVGDSLVPAPDNTKINFYLQRDTWHYETFTLNNGRINLNLSDVYGRDEFFYVAETRKGKQLPNVRVKWDDHSVELPAAPKSIETPSSDPYAAFASKKRIVDHSFKFPEKKRDGGAEAATTLEDEVMGADIAVELERYTSFQTMAEVIREVIPSLFHRKIGGRHSVRVNLVEPMMANASGGPVYIIDGIATSNVDFFMSLNPADLITVKVVKSPRKLIPYGIMGKNGIVIVQTKKGNLREPLDDPAKLMDGFSRPIPFTTRRDVNSPSPDFRSTLYWNGSVKTDASGKATIRFRASDDVGDFIISVDGLTTEGKAFSATGSLTISQSK